MRNSSYGCPVLQARMCPGELSATDVASMSSGKASKASFGKRSQALSSLTSASSQTSADLVDAMGKEWLVDVSQVCVGWPVPPVCAPAASTAALHGGRAPAAQHAALTAPNIVCGARPPALLQIKFVMDKERMPHKLGSGAQGTVYEVGGRGKFTLGNDAPGAELGRSEARDAAKARTAAQTVAHLPGPRVLPPMVLCLSQHPTQALLNGVEPVAVKVVPLGDATSAFLHEARMLRSLRHRNVVHLVRPGLLGPQKLGSCPCAPLGRR